MGTKKKVVDVDKEVLATASMAVKTIREGATRSGKSEIAILRVITKLIDSSYDVMEIRQ